MSRTLAHAVIATAAAMLTFAHVAAAASDVTFPPFTEGTLSNGARYALIERHETPLVALSIVLRGGALGDAPGKEGTASLLADLLQKGAGARDAAQFAEAVETAGGSLAASAGSESLGVGGGFLARDADLMLELAADLLERPRLSADEFAKARTLALQGLVAAKDGDPRGLIGSYGDAWLFRSHPYGRTADETTLPRITLDDVRRYYEDHVGGDRMTIVVAGDFEPAAMRTKLERSFGGWRKAAAPVPVLPPPARPVRRQVLLVDKPGAVQTYFWLGAIGASRADPGRIAQNVVNTAFGGRFTSMLNQALRVDTGLTYGAGASFDRGLQPGAWSISSYTRTEKTVEALDAALATLDRLHRDGLDATALESARNYMLGQFPTTFETNGALAGGLTDLWFYGLGPEDVNRFASRVQAVDGAAARAAIERTFPRSRDLQVVLIGDAAKIRAAVRKYGPVTEMKLTDPRFAPEAQ